MYEHQQTPSVPYLAGYNAFTRYLFKANAQLVLLLFLYLTYETNTCIYSQFLLVNFGTSILNILTLTTIFDLISQLLCFIQQTPKCKQQSHQEVTFLQ